jgi:hypothetical protein
MYEDKYIKGTQTTKENVYTTSSEIHSHIYSTLQNSSSGQGSPLYITSGDINSTNSNETVVIASRDTGCDGDCSEPLSDPEK